MEAISMFANEQSVKAVELLTAGSGCARGGVAPIELLRLPAEQQELLSAKCQNAQSALTGVFPYYAGAQPGPLSLYVRGLDYIPVLRKRLGNAAAQLQKQWPQAVFAVLSNCWPLPAVALARAAGVAITGQNGLAICPPYGSYVFLGAIVTDLRLPPVLPDAGFCKPDCGVCLTACPTNALSVTPDNRTVLDRSRCLSSISQHKEPNAEQLRLLAETPTLWGCDLCQLSCPYNENPELTQIPEFYENLLTLPLDENSIAGHACARHGIGHLKHNAAVCKLDEYLSTEG
jgi:epoxyqueuosine reductase